MADSSKGRARAFLIADVALIGGAGLLSYGAWLVFPPAGFIASGVLLLALGVSMSKAASRP